MTDQNFRLGALLMIAAALVFAMQDGISRHLAGAYNVYMVVMIRYWFFALFVLALAARNPGGLRGAVRTRHPVLQLIRGLLLAAEICVMVTAFTVLGLVESHAVFTCYPLLVAALSGPVLRARQRVKSPAATTITAPATTLGSSASPKTVMPSTAAKGSIR
jgi:drug/metabolite transporter (DMT)-like permease